MLCIDTYIFRLINMCPLLGGRWPNLHTLTLGVFDYFSTLGFPTPPTRSIPGFLASHPSLKSLSLHDRHREVSPWRFNMPYNALAHISKFDAAAEFVIVNETSFGHVTDLSLEGRRHHPCLFPPRKPGNPSALTKTTQLGRHDGKPRRLQMPIRVSIRSRGLISGLENGRMGVQFSRHLE